MRKALGKRFLSAISLFVIASIFLTACGGGSKQSNNSKTSGKVVTLTFWNGFTGPDRPGYEGLVKQFNDSHPNIKVTMDISPWDTLLAKLPTSIATGGGPDIAAFDSALIPKYAKAQQILPLDDLYSNGLDQNVFPKSLVTAMKYSDKFYGVPANFATLMLYYNKDLFKAAGLDPDKPPTTWDEWKKAITQTTKVNGNDKQYGLVLADHSTIAMWPILVWGNGGDFVTSDGKQAMINDSKTVDAIKYWSDLVTNNGISPTNLTGAEADKLFQSGKAAMEMNGPWMTAGYTQAGLNYDVAPVPAGPAGKVTLANSVAIVACKNTKNKDAVYEFMKFWNSKDSQAYLSSQTGFPPTRTDLNDDSRLKANKFVSKFAAVANDAKFYLQGIDQYDKIDTDVITPAIQTITNKKGSVQNTLNDANSKINDILQGK